MRKQIIEWYNKYFRNKYTLACDLSPFWGPHNEREQLFHYTGLLWTRHKAKDWCRIHPNGQSRIIPGWVFCTKKELKKKCTDCEE
jgi:hypothetical protein